MMCNFLSWLPRSTSIHRYWEANVAVHERGLELIKPGVRCRLVSKET